MKTFFAFFVFLFLFGACAPPTQVTPLPGCTDAGVATLLAEEEVFEVSQQWDNNNQPFQMGILTFATSQEGVGQFGQGEYSPKLFINGLHQVTSTWGGRAIGISTVSHVETMDHNFCAGTVSFTALVGFGTIHAHPLSGSIAYVGRQLIDMEHLEIRIDLCNADGCIEGQPSVVRVHVLQ